MGKRTLPFGYQISMGQIVVNTTEADLVNTILSSTFLGHRTWD